MARSLNKVELIGNLTRDPELRYTPAGTAVCTFGLATNRQWTTDSGEKKEDAEFHRIVAWNKLAELCSQLLTKGRKIYVEGRLQTRKWSGQDGLERTTTEIVINDMIILDSRFAGAAKEEDYDVPEEFEAAAPAEGEVAQSKNPVPVKANDDKSSKPKSDESEKAKEEKEEAVAASAKDEEDDDIPF